jgi:hypothetical protein
MGRILLALLLVPAGAAAGPRLEQMEGHLSLGWTKLFITDGPGGSISLAAGVDYPLARALRAGLDIGYDLLGSRTEQRGSLFGSVDYSAFQAVAFLHWSPEHLGPVRRVSLGPMLLNAHGDLSVTGGGAAFGDLAVSQTAGGVAAQVTIMQSKPAPVRLGLELGGRTAFLPGEDWTLMGARVTVHY